MYRFNVILIKIPIYYPIVAINTLIYQLYRNKIQGQTCGTVVKTLLGTPTSSSVTLAVDARFLLKHSLGVQVIALIDVSQAPTGQFLISHCRVPCSGRHLGSDPVDDGSSLLWLCGK